MFGKSVVFLIGVCLICHQAIVLAEPRLTCSSCLPNGDYTGKIVGLISRDEWEFTNYLFVVDGTKEAACLNFNDQKYQVRAKYVYDAMMKSLKVIIQVRREHEIAGIAFESPPPAETWFVTES